MMPPNVAKSIASTYGLSVAPPPELAPGFYFRLYAGPWVRVNPVSWLTMQDVNCDGQYAWVEGRVEQC